MAAIIRDGRLLLGNRHYVDDGKKLTISVWTTPGGKIDEGEDAEVGVVREVCEEIGVNDVKIISYLGEVPSFTKEYNVHVFHCEIDGEPKNMEPEKFSKWEWFSKNKIPNNFINPNLLEYEL